MRDPESRRTFVVIHRGDLVEFTDVYIQNYPPANQSIIRFGVATADGPINTPVETANGEIVTPRYVHAHGWAGWIPKDLEAVYEKYNPSDPYDFYPEED